MNFEHDVMISYAWKDNQPLPFSEQEGWVSGFHEGLEFWLKQIMPRNPIIWRDRNRMPGNKVFAEELDEIVQKTAVLLAVLSPPYMSSKWCARERENFVKAAIEQGGLQLDNDYRIFKVNKFPVDRKSLPEELQVVTGFNFYETDTETRQVEVIDPSLGEDEKRRFYKRVYEVAVVLSRFLLDVQNPTSGLNKTRAAEIAGIPAEAIENPEAPEKVVYLPYTTKDLRDVREALFAELTRRNCRVLPEQMYPYEDVEDFKAAALEDLSKADLSIHLIGARYGTILEGAQESIVELQNVWAAAESEKRKLKRLIWMPQNIGEVSERHAAFLNCLRSDRHYLAGADLMEDTVETLKTVVLDMLKPKREVEAEEGTDLKVYLIYDSVDADAVRDLRRKLRKYEVNGRSLKLLRPVFDGDASELREIHRQRLRDCDGVLLYWGGSSQAWLESILTSVRKAPGYGREHPFSGQHLVYITGEPTEAKEDWMLDWEDELFEPDLDAVEAFDNVPMGKLDGFFQALTGGGNA